jgi:DNA-binding CsgD family transcriptional regulator
MIGLGQIVSFQGDGDRAESFFTEGLGLLRAAGDTLNTALALVGLGALANHRAENERAESLLHEALALAQTIPETEIAASVAGMALSNLGVAAHGQGLLAVATSHHQAALDRYRAIGSTWGIARARRDLGDVARDAGDLGVSLRYYQEALMLVRQAGDPRVVTDALGGVAIVTSSVNPHQAARLFVAAQNLRETSGTTVLLAYDRVALERGVTAVQEALGPEAFAANWTAGPALSPEQAIDEALAIPLEALQASVTNESIPPSETITRTGLTDRELEVLRLLATGASNQMIADILYISSSTVKVHVSNLFGKLGLHSRAAAAAYAHRHGLE